MERTWEPLDVASRPAGGGRQLGTAIHWYDGALHAWVTPPERGHRWTGLHAVAALPLEIPYGPAWPGHPQAGCCCGLAVGGDTPRQFPGPAGQPVPAGNGPAESGGRTAGAAPGTAAPAAAPSPLSSGLTNACFNEVDRHVAAGRGDEAALVDITRDGSRSPRVLTRKQFLLAVVKAAHALTELGTGEGDRVLLRLPPSPAAACYLAAAKRLGAVALWAPPGRDEPAVPGNLAARVAAAGVRAVLVSGRDPGAAASWAAVPSVAAVIHVEDAWAGLAAGEDEDWPDRAGRVYSPAGEGRAAGGVHAAGAVRAAEGSAAAGDPARVYPASALLAAASGTAIANARAAGFPVAGEADLLLLPDADLVRALWATSRPRPVPADHPAWLDAAGRGGTHASAAAVAVTLAARIPASPGHAAVCVPAGDGKSEGAGEAAWPGVSYPDAIGAAMTLGVTVVLARHLPIAGRGGNGRARLRHEGLRVMEAAALLLRRPTAAGGGEMGVAAREVAATGQDGLVLSQEEGEEEICTGVSSGCRRRVLRLYSFGGKPLSPSVALSGSASARTRWITPDGEILWTHLTA
ncbi:MAG TPA: AMP-binding protein [Thermaerobacter sp.]